MRHSLYLKLITQFVKSVLTLTPHGRSKSYTYFSVEHDIPGLEGKAQKIEGSFHFWTRRLSLMIILAGYRSERSGDPERSVWSSGCEWCHVAEM